MSTLSNKANPLVSILILNWNGEAILEQCLKSVLKTSYQPIEILVLDNGSSDGSIDILKRYQSNVITHFFQENLGYATAYNKGIPLAKGEFIVTLNNDITVEPTWLETAIVHFKANSDVGIVGCRQMRHDKPGQIDSLYHFLGRKLFCYRATKTNDIERLVPGYVLAVNGGSAIYRKSMLNDIGLFDASFYAYHEEADLCLRAFWNGWDAIFEPASVVYHHGGYSFNKRSTLPIYLHERNRFFFMLRNLPLSFMLVRLPLLILCDIRDNLSYLKTPPSWFAYLRARFSVLIYFFQFRWLKANRSLKKHIRLDRFYQLVESKCIPLEPRNELLRAQQI